MFETTTFSHLGKWNCVSCGLKQPKPSLTRYDTYPLSGEYNKYNVHASVLVLHALGITDTQIKNAFASFIPAFGRQEIIQYQGGNIQLFLSKNPTSFNQSFATIKELHGKTILLVLNDRIPDGRDVSWIWDTDLTDIEKFSDILIAGDRVYDMALRLKYELGIPLFEKKTQVFENLKDAIDEGIKKTQALETLFILPTYSAMLDTRKVITGKKIL